MMSVHANLTSGGAGIAIQDFNALVGDLLEVLDSAHVPAQDRAVIVIALNPLCKQIVKNGTGCQ